jgi:hypothetical protein
MPEGPKETHPSYGMIGFSRTQGGGKRRLFGSAIRDHHTTIRMRVSRGEVQHDLSRDWYYGESQSMIEVELSAHQFAELLTSMNVGSGVPCTIRSINNKRIEDPPFREVEVEQISIAFQKNLQEKTTNLVKYLREMQQKLAGPGPIKATEKKEFAAVLARIQQEFQSNIPFAVTSYEEAADKIKSSAKAEVDAFLTQVVQKAGLKTLRESTPEEQQRLLTNGNEQTYCSVCKEPQTTTRSGLTCKNGHGGALSLSFEELYALHRGRVP